MIFQFINEPIICKINTLNISKRKDDPLRMKLHPLENIKNKKTAKFRPDGYCNIRVFHKKGNDKRSPRYLLKCGCCDEKLEIYYDKESLEINGVMGSIENWKDILLPLLGVEEDK